jgi:hypothetical protein
LDPDPKFHERRNTVNLESLEAESEALRQRSEDLAQLLGSGHPVVVPPADVLGESRRLGAVAAAARKQVASRLAAGLTPGAGVVVGRQPPVRRVQTDRRGRDLDPLHGRTVITPELVAYWEHRRDAVAPAVEGSYREAAERTPYSEALVAAAHGHLAVLQGRQSRGEGAGGLVAALKAYDDVFTALRQSAIDAQQVANQAQARLDSLEREKANSVVGGDQLTGFIAAALSTVTDLPVDPESTLPLVDAATPAAAAPTRVAGGGSPYAAKK